MRIFKCSGCETTYQPTAKEMLYGHTCNVNGCDVTKIFTTQERIEFLLEKEMEREDVAF